MFKHGEAVVELANRGFRGLGAMGRGAERIRAMDRMVGKDANTAMLVAAGRRRAMYGGAGLGGAGVAGYGAHRYRNRGR